MARRLPEGRLERQLLGDGYPLCQDLPADAFLRRGARYEFVGYSYRGPDRVMELASDSKLFAVLCGAASLPCPFKLIAELDGDVPCTGIVCEAARPKVLKVEKGFYQYAPPACVHLFFFSGRRIAPDSDRFGWSRTCENPAVALAGSACCAGCTDVPPAVARHGCEELKDPTGGDVIFCNDTWATSASCESIRVSYNSFNKKFFTSAKCNKHAGWVGKQYCALTCSREGAGYEGPGYNFGQCTDGLYREKQVCSHSKEMVSHDVAENSARPSA